MFQTSNLSSKNTYKIIGFLTLNYLIALPFFFYMIQTLDWENFYLPYLSSLFVFSILILVYILVFPLFKSKIKMLVFSFVWVVASAILVESFVLFLNNAKDFDGVTTIIGDYTLFVPVWIIITLIEFIGGIFLLKNNVIALESKYQFAFKWLISFWGLGAVTLAMSTSSFLMKALLAILIISFLMTYILQMIHQRVGSKYFRLLYTFLCISIFISVLSCIISITLNEFGSGSVLINMLYSFAAFSGGFVPITLLILIVNEKL